MRNTYLKTKDLNGNDVYINPLAVARVYGCKEEGHCAIMFYGRERELWIKEDHTEVAKLCRKFCEKSPITWGVERTPTGKNVAVLRRAPPQFSPDLSRIEFSCSPWDKKESLLEQSILFLGQAYHKNLSQITTSEVEAIITETPISELISGAEVIELGKVAPFIQVIVDEKSYVTPSQAILDLVNMHVAQEEAEIRLRQDVGPLKYGNFGILCYDVSIEFFERLKRDFVYHPQTAKLQGTVKLFDLKGESEIANYIL